MDHIFGELHNIEEMAKKVTSEAEEKKGKLPGQLEEKEKEIAQYFKEKTDEKIDEMRHEIMEDISNSIRQITLGSQERFSELERAYAQNQDRWVNEIVKSILGR